MDNNKQQLAVLKKSSRAGKLQRAAAPRVGRRLNSRRCSLRLSLPLLCSRNYRRSITTVVEWRERSYENYRTPTARDNPSIREEGGGGRRAGWCLGLVLQTMPGDGGDGRNLEQLLLSLETLRSDLEQYPDQPRSQTISRPTLHRSRSGRWIATRFLKTV